MILLRIMTMTAVLGGIVCMVFLRRIVGRDIRTVGRWCVSWRGGGMSGHFEKGRWVDSPPIGGGKWWVGHGAGYLTTEPEPVGINPRVFVGVPVFTPEQQRQFEEHVHQIAVERFKRKFGLSPPI